MDNLSLPYPGSSIEPDKDILTPSPEFKKNVSRVIISLISFFLVYLLLVFIAVCISAAMIALGVSIIITVHVLLAIALGGGLVFSGAMLIYFLVKFLFVKNEKFKRHEITEYEQPELFEFIRTLTFETGAPFPKHIYLTPEVNASVFFDSSFWSMFMPVKKNLNIGLALVNTLNQSEFKAVLAHEFGHFSQRSMRFGSYVYNLNKIIHNILYENSGYYNTLNAWARTHYILRFAAWINIQIVKGIQYVLKKMYVVINKTHLGLSREMEYQADCVAAYYGGANNMIAALRRIEVADNCYNTLLNFLTTEFNNGGVSTNAYAQHLVVLQQFAMDNHLKVDANGLPVITKDTSALNNPRVILNDQWASHPTMANREANLIKLNHLIEPVDKSAWLLFKNAEALQADFTKSLYANIIQPDKEYKPIDTGKFKFDFEKNIADTSFNKIYRGFYRDRLITTFDIPNTIETTQPELYKTFDDVFTDESCNLPKVIAEMGSDISLLRLIDSKQKEGYTFDFEGKKYIAAEALKVEQKIAERLKDAESRLGDSDKAAFMFFYTSATDDQLKEQLIAGYKQLFDYQEDSKKDYDNYNNIVRDINPIYTKMMPSKIYETLDKVYDDEEVIRARMKDLLATSDYISNMNDEQKNAIELYLSETRTYYTQPVYNNNGLEILNKAISAYVDVISQRNFNQKKALFDFQLTLINADK